MTNRLLWSICRFLIYVGRRRAVAPPDLLEILHYAICPRCRGDITAQGWLVAFKYERRKIYEVTFKAKRRKEHRQLSGQYVEDEEEEDEEDFKVERRRKLIAREKRPRRPKADFYV